MEERQLWTTSRGLGMDRSTYISTRRGRNRVLAGLYASVDTTRYRRRLPSGGLRVFSGAQERQFDPVLGSSVVQTPAMSG